MTVDERKKIIVDRINNVMARLKDMRLKIQHGGNVRASDFEDLVDLIASLRHNIQMLDKEHEGDR